MEYHKPVLLEQSVDGLDIQSGGVYVDATLGGGGHAREILKRLEGGCLVAFDQDEDARFNLPEDDDNRIIFVRHNFRYMKNFLKYGDLMNVDGIIADLGVSSHHFDNLQRGFAFRFDTPLDMRMNSDREMTAADVLNQYSVNKLQFILREYGEIRSPERFAQAIVDFRNRKLFKTTAQLVECLSKFAPKNKENKFFSKIFQAIRIEVNDEINSLKELLLQSVDVLKPGGRFVVIAYHALEDRLVKNFFRTGSLDGREEKDFFGRVIRPFEMINRKVIVPDEDEIFHNNRARSARLRIAERKSYTN